MARGPRAVAGARTGVLALCVLLAADFVAAAGPVRAADLFGVPGFGGPGPPDDRSAPAPRYFPRGEGEAGVLRARAFAPRRPGCAPRRVAVPTDAPDDPSYVGSAYGLSKPSFYGFRPPLGVDDPSGRPLRYCP